MMRGKYFNHKVKVDGEVFDSRLEYQRFLFLQDAERRGEIRNLRRQVPFEIIPKQTVIVKVELKTKTKFEERVVERPAYYVADFVYEKRVRNNAVIYTLSGEAHGTYDTWHTVVEDTKSKMTRSLADFRLKKKLLRYHLGIVLREVLKPTEEI